MLILKLIILLLVGIFAGFVNVLAGGGSLITLPLMIFMGLPSAVANGTNRIALLFQNAVGCQRMNTQGYFNYREALKFAAPAIAGSVIGASFAANIPDYVFNKILAVIMLAVLYITIKRPGVKAGEKGLIDEGKMFIPCLVFFVIGLYGGFIQAGIGFIIIAAFSNLSQMSIIKINAIKMFIIGSYSIAAIAIFALNGNINWLYGLTLAVGNSTGAWLSCHYAVENGEKYVYPVIIAMISIFSIRLMFF